MTTVKRAYTNVTIRYMLAVSIIATLLIGMHRFHHYRLSFDKKRSDIIHMSSRQVMLAQRIAALRYEIANAPAAPTAASAARNLKLDIDEMAEAHATLSAGNLDQRFPGLKSDAIRSIYRDPPFQLEYNVKTYLDEARDFLSTYTAQSASTASSGALNGLANAASNTLQQGLEQAVRQHQAEADADFTRFLSIQHATLLGGLFILFLEIFFIFRPMSQRIIQNMKGIEKEREKLAELDRLKSDFLATMSHEIRTPMNGILGMAELVIGNKSSDQVSSYARTIISSAECLLNIINDILDFSKIEAGRMELDPMPIDIVKLVDDMADLYCAMASGKAVEFVVRFAPGTEQFVYADPVRLRQVLSNLVSNAIKFTDKGHVILQVATEDDQIKNGSTCTLKFSIEDTGIGLSEDAKVRIFEKFSQADTSTTREYGGTGLGLSICTNLVELMGGNIAVESEEGKGSTFSFCLTLKRNQAEQQIKPNPPLLEGIRTLVVDDLPIIRQTVCEHLTEAKLRCDAATNGADALEMMQRAHADGDPYKIAILDYLMPDMSGEMLANAICSHDHLRETCLIMLTAAGNPQTDSDFAGKGFSSHISKPIRRQALIDSLAIIWANYDPQKRDVIIRVGAHKPGTQQDAAEDIQLPGARILVAEDSLINQVFIKELLDGMGCLPRIVSTGREAIETIDRGEEFDLIVMDCLMPVMDGFEAARALCDRKQAGTLKADLPILALTANAMKGDREKCLDAGMDDYLSKPVRKTELTAALYRLIKGHEPDLNVVESSTVTQEIPQPVHEPEILDQDAVATARDILKTKYEHMVDVYIDSCWWRIEDIMSALAMKDVTAVILPAHTLKSTSNQMGASKLAGIAKELEHIAKTLEGDTAHEQDALAQIAASIDAIKAALAETKLAFKSQAASQTRNVVALSA